MDEGSGLAPGSVIRRAADRFTSTGPGITGRHCFSYGAHYDPDNVAFGPLLACNEFTLEPGAGFPRHPHAGLEILSWVLEGELTHSDSGAATAPDVGHGIGPGQVQRLSAGTGVEHAEVNAGPGVLRFVQIWLLADRDGPPDYARADLRTELAAGGLVTVAAGAEQAPLTIRQADVSLHVAHLHAGTDLALPPARMRWIYLLRGEARFGAVALGTGDEVRSPDPGPLRATASDAGVELLTAAVDSS